MAEVLTKEQLQAAGFQDAQFNRFTIMAHGVALIYANGILYFQGMPLVKIDSEEHLREVLDALRMTPDLPTG